jgi:LysR family transcriptional regulator, cell division regulator
MKQLGAEVGVELFRRRGKRLELTEAAEELVRYAERIRGLVEEAPEAVRAKARRGGLVRVAASSTPGVSLLPNLIARSKPDVLVTLTVTNTEDVEEKIRRADGTSAWSVDDSRPVTSKWNLGGKTSSFWS